jgi:hypothetical protein
MMTKQQWEDMQAAHEREQRRVQELEQKVNEVTTMYDNLRAEFAEQRRLVSVYKTRCQQQTEQQQPIHFSISVHEPAVDMDSDTAPNTVIDTASDTPPDTPQNTVTDTAPNTTPDVGLVCTANIGYEMCLTARGIPVDRLYPKPRQGRSRVTPKTYCWSCYNREYNITR